MIMLCVICHSDFNITLRNTKLYITVIRQDWNEIQNAAYSNQICRCCIFSLETNN